MSSDISLLLQFWQMSYLFLIPPLSSKSEGKVLLLALQLLQCNAMGMGMALSNCFKLLRTHLMMNTT